MKIKGETIPKLTLLYPVEIKRESMRCTVQPSAVASWKISQLRAFMRRLDQQWRIKGMRQVDEIRDEVLTYLAECDR